MYVSLSGSRSYPWASAMYFSAGTLMSSQYLTQRMYLIRLIVQFSKYRQLVCRPFSRFLSTD